MLKYLILFTILPLAEIWLLIELGSLLGTWLTITLIALTGFCGVYLARSQGLALLGRMHRDLESGIIPAEPFFDGACILVGGALLLTPGFITDATGFFLLAPPSRHLCKKLARNYLLRRMEQGTLHLWWR